MDAWLALLAGCLACAVLSLLAAVPCVWATLIVRNKDLGCAVSIGYTLLMPLVVVAALVVPFGIPPDGGALLISYWLFSGTLMLTMWITLHVLRRYGWILVRAEPAIMPATLVALTLDAIDTSHEDQSP